jgi:arsenate reductase
MKRILVLCTGNSARSQMGEGLFRHEGRGAYEVESAGTRPSHVRPEAIAVMREVGIDISGHRSKSVNEFDGRRFDYVVTVCDRARDECPLFPAGAERIHWSFEDPAAVQGSEAERLAAFRSVREQLHQKVKAFFQSQPAVPGQPFTSLTTGVSPK